MPRSIIQTTIYSTIALGILLGTSLGAANVIAQDQNTGQNNGQNEGQAIHTSDPSFWRFGLSITNPGQAKGIVATSPIPIECPEQTVELIAEEFGDNVKGVKVKPLKPLARQMVFKIASLGPGQGGTTALSFKITKRPILLPENTEAFVFDPNPRGKLKSNFLGPSPYIESKDKKIVAIADTLAKQHAGKPAWNQVEAIYDWVRAELKYEFAVQQRSCLAALADGKGDCQEMSGLFIAICRARRIPARAVWIPGHTYPEFYLLDEKGEGHWFPCQLAGTRQFGEMNERRPILQKGDRVKVLGQKELLPYAQSSIISKDASAALSIEQIAEELAPQ